MPRAGSVGVIAALLIAAVGQARAADTLPERLPDDVFWRSIQEASEPGGTFFAENLVSNELEYPDALRYLQKVVKPGGVLIGVGPEQNFSYAAALRPKLVFVIDIRRENLLEHLLYKALFELSTTRADFLARLFSRAPLAHSESDVELSGLLQAVAKAPPDLASFKANLAQVLDVLVRRHGFALLPEDQAGLGRIYRAFFDAGPGIAYSTSTQRSDAQGVPASAPAARRASEAGSPSFTALATARDSHGAAWSYLATEASYQRARDLELRNLIVPVVGDLAGPTALRWIGSYLRGHGAKISVFYVSNVEMYLFSAAAAAATNAVNGGWKRYLKNVAALPLDEASLFVRFPGAEGPVYVRHIEDDLGAMRTGHLPRQSDTWKER